MHIRPLLLLFCLLLITACPALSQNTELEKVIFQLPTLTSELSVLFPLKNEEGKKSVARTFFVLYKRHISYQDIPGVCNFETSCSEYGLLAVKKHGAAKGMLYTFDRLMRCNPFIHYEPSYQENGNGKYMDWP